MPVLSYEFYRVGVGISRRMDRIELLFKVFIGLVVVELTLLNPAFVELSKTVFSLR